ncbi:MAG: hypothetical protein JNL82_17180 [Myxococcales bacterium]|nr:hypothetical protein [Myxococcales bacterium]
MTAFCTRTRRTRADAPPRADVGRALGRWSAALLGALALFVCVGPARAGPAPRGPVTAGPDVPVPPAPIVGPAASEVRVHDVSVRLKIHRGGERLADGRKVARRGAVVEGEAVYRLERPAAAGDRLVLLNYAAVLPKEPIELDEVAVGSYLDGPFQAGELDVVASQVVVGGPAPADLRRIGARGDIEVVLRPGTTELRLSYRVTVPHRYWPFGCSQRRCSLAGALAPLPSVPAVGGPSLPSGRVVDPVIWDVAEVRFAAVPTWSPGHVPSASEQRALGGDEIVVTRETIGGDGRLAYPSVYWGRRWRRAGQDYRGVHIEVLHTLWRPGDQVPSERRAQLYRDVPGHALLVARQTIDIARAAGLEAPLGSTMTIVQGPLRHNIAEYHPSSITLSDQFMQVWPGKRFMQFHTAVVARASLDLLTYGPLVGRHNPSVDLWLHDALAVALLDVWRVHRDQADEYALDIFRNFTFVPTVDNFLYSGQASFASAYFRGSDDVMPVRIHPLYFSHELPSGRRIHEKLGDLMTPSQRAQIYKHLVADPSADPRRLAEQAYGHQLGWFFDQWLAPHPDVDYSVRSVITTPDGSRFHHRITIGRDGTAPLLEPVQVLVQERGGRRHYLVWNGETIGDQHRGAEKSASHTFDLVTDRELRAVSVDPRARLVETPLPPRANVDPLFNNRHPAGGRFIYSGIGVEVATAEFAAAETAAARLQAVSGRVLFEASNRRDIRRTGHLQFNRDREASVALGGGASLWFGKKVNRRRRIGRVRLFADVQWLNPESLDQVGGLRFNQSAAIVHDDRKFSLWPDRGHRLAFSVGAGQTLRLDDERRYSLQFYGGWTQIWPLAHEHTLASRLELSIMAPLGTRPEYRSLLRAGGLDGLGAYGGNELFGRALALAQLEYRHFYARNLDWNLLHLLWIRAIGGALFTGVASMSHCDDYRGWFGKQSWYAQVGYGVTAQMQALGVNPQFIRFDVGVPLIRRQYTCLGNSHPTYLGELQGIPPAEYSLPPVGVNVTFLQPF